MISDKTIEEFQAILKNEYGREISIEKTKEIINGLILFYDIAAKIWHRKKIKEKNK